MSDALEKLERELDKTGTVLAMVVNSYEKSSKAMAHSSVYVAYDMYAFNVLPYLRYRSQPVNRDGSKCCHTYGSSRKCYSQDTKERRKASGLCLTLGARLENG